MGGTTCSSSFILGTRFTGLEFCLIVDCCCLALDAAGTASGEVPAMVCTEEEEEEEERGPIGVEMLL